MKTKLYLTNILKGEKGKKYAIEWGFSGKGEGGEQGWLENSETKYLGKCAKSNYHLFFKTGTLPF